MAVCWRCPVCAEVTCEDDVTLHGERVECGHCHAAFAPPETQCPVCDAVNPWARRDTLHYWCRECGNTQTFYSQRRSA